MKKWKAKALMRLRSYLVAARQCAHAEAKTDQSLTYVCPTSAQFCLELEDPMAAIEKDQNAPRTLVQTLFL